MMPAFRGEYRAVFFGGSNRAAATPDPINGFMARVFEKNKDRLHGTLTACTFRSPVT